ncbi:S-layer homology domain-containing protein [Paenibacillus albus]|uniref:S-layer homology domain-containing protein n=1 Tax=Paenibacillus albus TaxID=2495582 RepID=A0A3S9A4E5_9BACL|nr:S-layer homology domain-containing protein [Paenibacillus albus]AZN40576.1 S-layer homology domain-containing protein [Paenibacillus albus]
MNVKKPLLVLSLLVVLFLAVTQSVWAFSDTKNDPNEAKITELQKRGILNGNGSNKDQFGPNGKVTYAAGITMLVKGLGLNIDNIRFFKKPEVSDSFSMMKNDAWYADTFIIAAYNELDLARDTNPAAAMTREQFAHHLYKALIRAGNFAFNDLGVVLKDEADVNPSYMGSIQTLITTHIIDMDASQKFNPKAAITRSEAAGWLFNTIKYVEEQPQMPVEQPEPSPLFDLKLTTTAVNNDVNAVTISAQAPNPGYGIRIASISFEGDQAIIYVEPTYPDKDKMYPQVITEVKAVTYVSSAFKPVLGESGASIGGSTGIIGDNGTSAADSDGTAASAAENQ